MSKYLINIALIAFPLLAWGQKDTTKLSFKQYYVPTGIRLGLDLVPIGRGLFSDSFSGKEFQADIDFYRYHLTFDYGNWSRSYAGTLERETVTGNITSAYNNTFDYQNDGRYFRVGVDVNFLLKDPDRNMFFVGGRYGRASFDEYYYIDEDLPDFWWIFDPGARQSRSFVNSNTPAQWFELTTGVRIKVYKFIWMGYTARFKFGLKTGNTPELLPHDVPGFGRTDKESTWGFNYHIMFRIPVRDYPPIPVKKKKKK
jgi:Domain of unknown function (DUF6048)